ncbi:MAG: sigma-70 family RNA polymerase sigma factor [Myxococcales bacterium]
MFPSGHGARPALSEADWLGNFHRGERRCLESCYRDHFGTVDRAVAFVVAGADRETLVHEVFFRLLTDEQLRRGFRGGAFSAWLRVVARNQAIDYARRRRVEVSFAGEPNSPDARPSAGDVERQIDVRVTLERFRERRLPPKWRPVFDARFVAQHDQPTAARLLGMSRTTLAYQEYRIRRLLRMFVLQGRSQ